MLWRLSLCCTLCCAHVVFCISHCIIIDIQHWVCDLIVLTRITLMCIQQFTCLSCRCVIMRFSWTPVLSVLTQLFVCVTGVICSITARWWMPAAVSHDSIVLQMQEKMLSLTTEIYLNLTIRFLCFSISFQFFIILMIAHCHFRRC